MTHEQICSMLTAVMRFIGWPLLILAVLAIAWAVKAFAVELGKDNAPRWEAVRDARFRMWRVRWSQPDRSGLYLYVRQYGGLLAEDQAKLDANCLNHEGRTPSYYPEWAWKGQP